MGDEVAVEIAYAKERSDVFDLHGGRPFGDPLEFGRVHGYLTRSDDHSKVINFLGIESALGWFQEKTLLSEDIEDSASLGVMFF